MSICLSWEKYSKNAPDFDFGDVCDFATLRVADCQISEYYSIGQTLTNINNELYIVVLSFLIIHSGNYCKM